MSLHLLQPGAAPFPLKLPTTKELDAAIEALIELRNALDGDTDLEEEQDFCLAGDDGCGPVRSIAGGLAWGTDQEDTGAAFPLYGEDQSLGPINYNEENRRIMREQFERGYR